MNQGKGMRALRMLFAASVSVTCASCGLDLTHENQARLARLGCPDCGSKEFTFTTMPEAENAAQSVVGRVAHR